VADRCAGRVVPPHAVANLLRKGELAVPATTYDTFVIGGGLGGLLAAASACRSGQSVLVVERLPYPGGRFTTVAQEGTEVTTGALHLVPHGHGGVLARLLADLGVGFRGVPGNVFVSFFAEGQSFSSQNVFQVARHFSWAARVEFVRAVARLLALPSGRGGDSFQSLLDRSVGDPRLMRLFERFVEFAMSVTAEEISCRDVREVCLNILRYGLPEAPVGGCKAVIEDLVESIERQHGTIRTMTEVVGLIYDDRAERVVGARIRDRVTGLEEEISARQVVSDAGPRATTRLLGDDASDRLVLAEQPSVARGLKLHVVSDKSLIPHNGIMFCLDTQRISGIVQVSNAVPAVVPDGMYMLDTFQVLRSDDIAEERRLAVEDLRYIFGADYDRHCRVLRSSAFRGSWPVNHVTQGNDRFSQTPIPGLVMVGDAYKPPGHMMVEGVAGSVRKVLPIIERRPRPSSAG
jgi:phytoene dehydrogenase-like protein